MSPNECLFNILLYHRTVKRHTEVEILAKGFTNTMKQHAFFSTISKTRFFTKKFQTIRCFSFGERWAVDYALPFTSLQT